MGLRFVFAVFLLVGCGGPTTPGELSGVGAARSVGGETTVRHDDGPLGRRFGRIQYEARSPDPNGASAARELRAGRWLRLRFVRGDRVLVETRSDGLGAFDAQVPAAADALLVDARVQFQDHDLEVTADRAGEEGYSHRVELGGPAATSLDVRIGDDGDGLAGAFHILDRMLDGSLAVREWTGRELAPFYAYWGRGVTTDWSFYLGRCGDAEAGRYCIELLGGEPGQQSTTDTDEHDDAIILHESAIS